ncbi:MAG: hypothetical protein U5L04_01790 [Trueperaceae bacterium]|nr:hypothetical protein [Trueperaceae bacterium]
MPYDLSARIDDIAREVAAGFSGEIEEPCGLYLPLASDLGEHFERYRELRLERERLEQQIHDWKRRMREWRRADKEMRDAE